MRSKNDRTLVYNFGETASSPPGGMPRLLAGGTLMLAALWYNRHQMVNAGAG